MGARAGLVACVMSGAQLKASGVHFTLSLARHLGAKVIEAQQRKSDVPQVVAEALDGQVIFRGKISDVNRRTTKGFARGWVRIDRFTPLGPPEASGGRLEIEFQNELLIARINGKVVVTTPDLICIVTEEEGEPVTTESLRLWHAGGRHCRAGAGAAQKRDCAESGRSAGLRLRCRIPSAAGRGDWTEAVEIHHRGKRGNTEGTEEFTSWSCECKEEKTRRGEAVTRPSYRIRKLLRATGAFLTSFAKKATTRNFRIVRRWISHRATEGTEENDTGATRKTFFRVR